MLCRCRTGRWSEVKKPSITLMWLRSLPDKQCSTLCVLVLCSLKAALNAPFPGSKQLPQLSVAKCIREISIYVYTIKSKSDEGEREVKRGGISLLGIGILTWICLEYFNYLRTKRYMILLVNFTHLFMNFSWTESMYGLCCNI